MTRRYKLIFWAALAAAFLAGFGAVRAADSAAAPAPVEIINFGFQPGTLTVPVGTTVTWTNKDVDTHSVQSADKRFTSSPALEHGESYTFTFTTAGTYEYLCSLHSFMKGKIVVTDAGAAARTP